MHVRRGAQWKPSLLDEPGTSLDSGAVRPWADCFLGGPETSARFCVRFCVRVCIHARLQRKGDVNTKTRALEPPPGGASHAATDDCISGGIDLKRARQSTDGDSDHVQRCEEQRRQLHGGKSNAQDCHVR